MIFLFTSAIMSAFAECRYELERLRQLWDGSGWEFFARISSLQFLNATYFNDLSDNAIFIIAIYANDTLCSKYDQASDTCQQLESTSELEPDLGDTVDWGEKQKNLFLQ